MKTHTLRKIKSTHNNLRTDVIEGFFNHPPKEGERFVFLSEPLEDPEASFRQITTSPVKNLDLDKDTDVITFGTYNSTYLLEPNKND